MVKWMENKCVTIGTNYDNVGPTFNVQRWNTGAKKKASVVRTEVLNTYKKSLRGVDMYDWLTSKYTK